MICGGKGRRQYLLLYYVWRSRYQISGRKGVCGAVWVLAISRIVLCLMPQNAWQSAQMPLSWGIYRNIPFTLLGALIVVMFYRSTKEKQEKSFRFLWLAVVLSFACYLPVVLFADAVPAVGMLIFLVTALFADRYGLEKISTFRVFLWIYNIGVPLTAVMFFGFVKDTMNDYSRKGIHRWERT